MGMRPMGEIEISRNIFHHSVRFYITWTIYDSDAKKTLTMVGVLNIGMMVGFGFWEALRWTLSDLSDEWSKHGIDWANAPEVPA